MVVIHRVFFVLKGRVPTRLADEPGSLRAGDLLRSAALHLAALSGYVVANFIRGCLKRDALFFFLHGREAA